MNDVQVQAWLDQEDEWAAQTIREHGWAIQFVFPCEDDPGTTIAYTIGLFGMGHPELVVTGLDAEGAGCLLNDVGERVRKGQNLIPGQLLTFEHWPHRVFVEEIPNPEQILFAANRHAQRPDEASVPAFALTYDDRNGRFPWESGYSVPAWVQPRPGTFTA